MTDEQRIIELEALLREEAGAHGKTLYRAEQAEAELEQARCDADEHAKQLSGLVAAGIRAQIALKEELQQERAAHAETICIKDNEVFHAASMYDRKAAELEQAQAEAKSWREGFYYCKDFPRDEFHKALAAREQELVLLRQENMELRETRRLAVAWWNILRRGGAPSWANLGAHLDETMTDSERTEQRKQEKPS